MNHKIETLQELLAVQERTVHEQAALLESKNQVLLEQTEALHAANLNLQQEIQRRIALETLEEEQRQFLERIVQGEPLPSLLTDLAGMAQRQLSKGLCSILTLPDHHLFHAGGSRHSAIGPGDRTPAEAPKPGASLGKAQVQIVENIDRDPFWRPYWNSGPLQGLKCCWFLPTVTGDHRLLGFFSVHHPESSQPEPSDIQVLAAMNDLAALTIEHRRLTASLAHQAQYDTLTDLPNRFLFRDRLTQALAHASRSGTRVGLLFLDLDGFKRINDTLGHQMGDKVLVEVAQRLRAILRRSDTLARMGGDEFMMILSSPKKPSDAAVVAQKCLDALREPLRLDGHQLSIGTSIGISIFPDDAKDSDEAQHHADLAMYQAKSRGKSCFQFFTPGHTDTALERLELESHLRHALDHRELLLVYQPQVDKNGGLAGFEALLRWKHPRLGMIPPVKFIPIAEESGLILSIGDWALHEACRQMAAWRSAGYRGLVISVNVSLVQFERPDWPRTVDAILKETGLPPSSLELELAESAVMQHVKEASARLDQLRQLGVRFAIDDFGTGYSSLNYLQRLPIDTLKIDQSFIQDISVSSPEEISSSPIVVAILALAHSLGLNVVAEGVETGTQAAFLREQGCDGMQGYYFARPMSPGACEPFLRQSTIQARQPRRRRMRSAEAPAQGTEARRNGPESVKD